MQDFDGIMRVRVMEKAVGGTFNFLFFFHMLGRKRKGVSDFMKSKKRLAAVMLAVRLAVCALPYAVMAYKKEEPLKKVTLNEVAHSIFYAPQYVAIEKGYFKEEGLDVELVTGFGADKVLTALISGEADIGFMGAEASVYAYQEGATDPAVNFAQLTQRAGNFLVARKEMPDFQWSDLKGKKVLGGRKGGVHISM